jgi:hypothetical protein
MKKGNFKLLVYTGNLKTHPVMKELNVRQDERDQDYCHKIMPAF